MKLIRNQKNINTCLDEKTVTSHNIGFTQWARIADSAGAGFWAGLGACRATSPGLTAAAAGSPKPKKRAF